MTEKGLTVRMKTDMSGFKKGMDEVVAELEKYNKALVDNQYKQRECNKVISDAKKRIKELNETQKEKGKLDENEEKELKKLTETIEEEKVKLSQLRTEQASLRNVISETTRSLTENEKGWSVLKATLANLASDTLKKLGSSLANIARDVISTGEQFSASMSEVGAISGATAEQLQELEDTARLYGATTKFSATESADALKYMALAGWDAQQSIAGLPAVLDLAAASGMDLGRASDIVTDYITAFGLEVEDASRFVDIMSYAMSHSNTTTEMLGDAYKNCAATAKSMGFSVEETTAALMTMANAGVKGGEAGTTLNTLMTRLATNTKGCADELKKYGVEIYDAQGNMNSLSEIMNGLISVFSGLTQEQQANLSKMIAGTNQYAGFQTLMQGMSDKVKAAGMSFEDYTAALKECEGTSNDMAKTMSNNLSGDLKTLQSALDELKLKIFEDAEQPLRNLVKLANNGLVPALDGIIKNLQKVLPVVIGFSTALATLKLNLSIGKIVTELTEKIKAYQKAQEAATVATEAATVAQEGLNAAQKANVIGLVITAVVSLISAFTTLAVVTNSNADATDNANEKTKNYLATLQNLDQQHRESLENIQAESDRLKDIQKEYDTLRTETSLTADEKSRLNTVAEQLAKTLDVSTDKLKDKNGAYIDITDSIDEYIKKLEEQAVAEYHTDALKESYVAYNNAKDACEEYSQKIQEQQKVVDDTEKHLEKLQQKLDSYKFHNFYYYSDLKEFNAVKQELEEQQTTLDNLNGTWKQYYADAGRAVEGIIEHRQALGYTVDAEKEQEERLDSINIYLDKSAQKTETLTQKTTASSAAVSAHARQTADLQIELSNLAHSSDSAADRLTALNKKLDENQSNIKKAKEQVALYQQRLANAQKLRDENYSEGSAGYQLYSQTIDDFNQKLADAKDNLANLHTQGAIIRSSIALTKDEIRKTAKSAVSDFDELEKAVQNIVNAIDNTQKSAKLLATAEKEIADNGKFTLNTLNSIQKTYPKLIDLTNDYINGITTEKQVIEGLKVAYENDKSDFANAVMAKKLISQNYSEEYIQNVVNLFDEVRNKYDIDVENFKNAADAKQAINARLYDEMMSKQKEYDNFINSSQYYFSYYQGQPVLMVKRNGKFEDATPQELQAYLHEMNEKSENSYQAWKNYTDFQNVSSFEDILDAYKSGRKSADNLYNFINTEANANANSSKTTSSDTSSDKTKEKNTVTLSGNGVTASGNTYTQAYLTWIDRMKSLGKMSDDVEISHLEQLKKRSDNTADEIYQIDLKLYQARTKLSESAAKQQQDIAKKQLDEYQSQLDLAKAAYEKYVNGKIDAQKQIAQQAQKSADAEIAALDAVMKKRQQEKDDQKRKAEIDNINARLRDNKNQLTNMEISELYRRKQDLINEQNDVDFQRSVEQQKAAIQANADKISLNAENAVANLQDNLSSFINHLAVLTGSQTAAQKVVNNNQQQNIQIVQNALSNDQLVQKLLRELQKNLYSG